MSNIQSNASSDAQLLRLMKKQLFWQRLTGVLLVVLIAGAVSIIPKVKAVGQELKSLSNRANVVMADLEVLAEKIEQYALPELEKLAAQPPSPELMRWQQLAAQIMPQIEDLALQDPEGYEELKLWIKQKARRWRESVDEGTPPLMARWREEIRQLPGFAEQWDLSPALRDQVFNWFTHALYLHP